MNQNATRISYRGAEVLLPPLPNELFSDFGVWWAKVFVTQLGTPHGLNQDFRNAIDVISFCGEEHVNLFLWYINTKYFGMDLEKLKTKSLYAIGAAYDQKIMVVDLERKCNRCKFLETKGIVFAQKIA